MKQIDLVNYVNKVDNILSLGGIIRESDYNIYDEINVRIKDGTILNWMKFDTGMITLTPYTSLINVNNIVTSISGTLRVGMVYSLPMILTVDNVNKAMTVDNIGVIIPITYAGTNLILDELELEGSNTPIMMTATYDGTSFVVYPKDNTDLTITLLDYLNITRVKRRVVNSKFIYNTTILTSGLDYKLVSLSLRVLKLKVSGSGNRVMYEISKVNTGTTTAVGSAVHIVTTQVGSIIVSDIYTTDTTTIHELETDSTWDLSYTLSIYTPNDVAIGKFHRFEKEDLKLIYDTNVPDIVNSDSLNINWISRVISIDPLCIMYFTRDRATQNIAILYNGNTYYLDDTYAGDFTTLSGGTSLKSLIAKNITDYITELNRANSDLVSVGEVTNFKVLTPITATSDRILPFSDILANFNTPEIRQDIEGLYATAAYTAVEVEAMSSSITNTNILTTLGSRYVSGQHNLPGLYHITRLDDTIETIPDLVTISGASSNHIDELMNQHYTPNFNLNTTQNLLSTTVSPNNYYTRNSLAIRDVSANGATNAIDLESSGKNDIIINVVDESLVTDLTTVNDMPIIKFTSDGANIIETVVNHNTVGYQESNIVAPVIKVHNIIDSVIFTCPTEYDSLTAPLPQIDSTIDDILSYASGVFMTRPTDSMVRLDDNSMHVMTRGPIYVDSTANYHTIATLENASLCSSYAVRSREFALTNGLVTAEVSARHLVATPSLAVNIPAGLPPTLESVDSFSRCEMDASGYILPSKVLRTNIPDTELRGINIPLFTYKSTMDITPGGVGTRLSDINPSPVAWFWKIINYSNALQRGFDRSGNKWDTAYKFRPVAGATNRGKQAYRSIPVNPCLTDIIDFGVTNQNVVTQMPHLAYGYGLKGVEDSVLVYYLDVGVNRLADHSDFETRGVIYLQPRPGMNIINVLAGQEAVATAYSVNQYNVEVVYYIHYEDGEVWRLALPYGTNEVEHYPHTMSYIFGNTATAIVYADPIIVDSFITEPSHEYNANTGDAKLAFTNIHRMIKVGRLLQVETYNRKVILVSNELHQNNTVLDERKY